MSIAWGSWEYSGGNGMRVGVEATISKPSHSSSSVTATFKIWTGNQYNYGDPQTMNFEGNLGGSSGYTNNQGSGSSTLRFTKTYTYTYPGGSYGSSPGSVSGGGTVSGAYNGVTPSKTVSIAVPARPYATPAAPHGMIASRNSDTSAAVRWSNNPSSGAPYTNLTLQRQTYTNGSWGSFSTIATLSGGTTSYTDTKISANHIFKYQVRANNSVGSSGWAQSGFVYTTPAAPTSVSAAMGPTGTTIAVTWTRADYRSSDIRFTVQRSVNGAAYGTVASLINATSWTDNAPGGGSNTYQVQAVSTAPNPDLASGFTKSNVVATIVPPLAPSNLSPNGVVIDLGQDATFSWKHNPGGDQAAQSKAELSTSADAGVTWTVLVTLTQVDSSYLLSAGTLTNGPTYQWRVRTQGVASVGWSPYSAVATVTGRDQPTVTLDPAQPPPSLGVLPLVVAWEWNQGQGDLQAAWVAELYGPDNTLLETLGASDASTSATFSAAMADQVTYTVRVRGMSSRNQWSEWATTTTTVSLLPPVAVPIQAEEFSCSGTVGLTLIPDEAVEGSTVPVDYVDVQRRINGGEWVTIMVHVEVPTSVLDMTPPSVGTTEYRLIITSITPSQQVGPIVTVEGENLCEHGVDNGEWVFVSYGLDFSTVLRFHGNPEIGSTTGRTRVAQHFLGRPDPVALLGGNTTTTVKAAGALHYAECCYELDPAGDCHHDSPVADWEAAGTDSGVVLYRDYTGRRIFGLLSEVECSFAYVNYGTVSFTVTEIDYDEAVWTGELPDTPDGGGGETEASNLYCYGDFEDAEDVLGLVTGGLAVLTQDTAWASQGATSLRITPNGTYAYSAAYLSNPTNDGGAMRILGLAKGLTYTVSADIHIPVVQSGTLDPQARTISVMERRGGTNTWTQWSTPAPNAVGTYRVKIVYTVPTDAALQDVCFRLTNGSSVAAQYVNFDAVMIEQGETEGTWNEGCIVTPTNLLALNPSFEDPYTGSVSRCVGARSSAWASQGQYCLALTPDGINGNGSYAPIGGGLTYPPTVRDKLRMQPGHTYTLSADYYQSTAQQGTLDTKARTLSVVWSKGTNPAWSGSASSNQPANLAGVEQRVVLTVAIPSDAVDIGVNLYSGSANSGDVSYWDAVMIEEGTTAGVWTDGIVGA